MLETLMLDQFIAHVGTNFACLSGDGGTLPVQLMEATPLGKPMDAPAENILSPLRRQPFSLIFLGPLDPVLPQSMYSMEHAQMGMLAIFLVPVGRNASGMRYQAIFT